MPRTGRFNRRRFLQAAAASTIAAPLVIPGSALGADGATPANERIVMGAIGMGGQGRGDLGGFLGFPQVQVVAVCDVVGQASPVGQGEGRPALRQQGLPVVQRLPRDHRPPTTLTPC